MGGSLCGGASTQLALCKIIVIVTAVIFIDRAAGVNTPPKLLSKDEDNPDLDNSAFLLLLLLRYVVELKRQPYDERLN